MVRRCETNQICLQKLSLANNGLTSESGESLAKILDIVGSLRELDLSDNKVEADGLKKLARALATERCTLRTLNLFNNHLGKGCVKQLAIILLRNRSITSLNLGKNRLNNKKCITELSNALCHNEFLQRLDLSQNKMGNAGATQLADILNPHKSSCPLQELNLTNNNLTDSGVEHIIGTMIGCGNTRLEKLVLSHNKLTSDGVKYCALYLERSHTIRELVLSSCHVEDQGVELLCKGLSCIEFCGSSSRLRRLDLSWNRIHNSGAMHLAEMLENDCDLEYLNLASNAIGSAGAQAFCFALRSNLTLQELDLAGNQIGNFGAVRLAEFVCDDDFALKTLKWEGNKRMTDAGRARLTGAFRFRQSKQTWLSEKLDSISKRKGRLMQQLNLKVGDEEMICICQHLDRYRPILPLVTFQGFDGSGAVTSRGVEALAKTVRQNINLNRLRLQNTLMGDIGAAAIAQALVYNHNLTVLSLTSCALTDQGARFLANTLKRRGCTIQRLDLKMNRIGDRGAKELFEAISQAEQSTTYSLNLSYNRLTDVCFGALSTFEPLKEVHLGYNMITDRGALDMAKVCMNSRNLGRLHVPGNFMTKKGVQALNLFIPEDIGIYESGNQRPLTETAKMEIGHFQAS
ncbi:hypothetical protein ACA910_020236 [Epithemia clementina (nom. ined.)]